ncbi:MAG: response regulator [Clostridiales bacterium]|jgi:two-component system response regulator YesN|nr:response regulator [Clostridiales bacterium]
MISLLLVDDESATRNGLVKHMTWKALGVDKVVDAADAFEAIKIAEDAQPDIVVSDVKMPGMEGTRFCERLVKRFPGCKVIFISGYSNEEYLKAAIKIHALSYVEKPINLQELCAEVKKAAELCLSERKAREEFNESAPFVKRRHLLELLRSETTVHPEISPDKNYTVAIAEFYSDNESGLGDPLLARASDIAEKVFAPSFCLSAAIDQDRIAVISEEDTSQKRHKALFVELKKAASDFSEGSSVFLAVGPSLKGLAGIAESYVASKDLNSQVFFSGFGRLAFFSKEATTQAFEMDIPATFKNMSFNSEDELVASVESIRQKLHIEHGSVSETKNFFLNLCLCLCQGVERLALNPDETAKKRMVYIWETICGFKTLDETASFLVDEIHFIYRNGSEQNLKQRTITKVKQFICENYSKELTVKLIAKSVYLSPSYLSYLFKSMTDTNLNEHITEVRVEKSKEMLKDKRIKLYEVAKSVGYNDPNYYAKVFKKVTGITPSAYREKQE